MPRHGGVGRHHVDEPTAESDGPLDPGHQRVVLASLDEVARLEAGTALTNDDRVAFQNAGLDHGIAMEASLKIKEICYIHCESYSLGTLKHGPFALLEQSMPVILIHTQQQFESKILSCYEEIVSRGSPVYVITPFRSFQKPNTIYIPENKTFSFLLAVIPFQLLAYHIAIQKDIDPDTPRNLAKVVTVE